MSFSVLRHRSSEPPIEAATSMAPTPDYNFTDIRTFFARAIAQKYAQKSAGLKLPDIDKILVLDQSPGFLKLHLEPNPHPRFSNRIPHDWLQIASSILLDKLEDSPDRFFSPSYNLRRMPSTAPIDVKLIARLAAPRGGLKLRFCNIELELLGQHKQCSIYLIESSNSDLAKYYTHFENLLLKHCGKTARIICQVNDDLTSERLLDQILNNPRLRRAGFIKEHDDPAPKLLRKPTNLVDLTWLGLDHTNTTNPEDIITCHQTPRGIFVLAAVPLGLWASSFSPKIPSNEARSSGENLVLFFGGIPHTRGLIERMRVGWGLVSKPELISCQASRAGKLSTEGKQTLELLRQALCHNAKAALSEEALVTRALLFAQRVLVNCLRHKQIAAYFSVDTKYQAAPRSALRARDLLPSEHTIAMKLRFPGAALNQQQLLRVLKGKPPLAKFHFKT